MTADPSIETVWTVIKTSAVEAVHMYFDPLYRISAWLSGKRAYDLKGQNPQQEEVEPSGIKIRKHYSVSFGRLPQLSENKVLEKLRAGAQYDESRKVMEIVMKTWHGEIGAVSRVRERMLKVHRQVETLGRNDVAAEMINRLTEITDYSLDRTVVLQRVKALEQQVRELEPDTVRSVVLFMDAMMDWNERPHVQQDRAVERE